VTGGASAVRSPGSAVAAGDGDGAAHGDGEGLDELRSAGWVLPLALATGGRPAWTLVGTVDSRWATMVDPRGLVTPSRGADGFSLDWWIGADDRWHLPSREAGVRQRLIGDAPVVETLMRIPGGDAVQRVYGITAPASAGPRDDAGDGALLGRGGDEYVVIEVENRSSVPFALALAVRPFSPERRTEIVRMGLQPVAGGSGRDQAYVATANATPAVVFPRRPARAVGSCGGDGDVAHVVLAGLAPEPPPPDGQSSDAVELASCPDGLAHAALVFPLAHTAVLRCVIPLGGASGAARRYPAVIPSAEQVAAGWDAHAERGARLFLPDQRLQEAVVAARRSLLLAPWGDGLRHAGPLRGGLGGSTGDVRDTALIVGCLDRAGHHDESTRTLARWPVTRADHAADRSPMADLAVIHTVATHRLLTGGTAADRELFDDLLPDVVAAVARLEKAGGDLDDLGRCSAVGALRLLARALTAAGQPKGARDIAGVADRFANDQLDRRTVAAGSDVDHGASARSVLLAVRAAIAARDPQALDLLATVLASASPTHAVATEHQGHDLVVAALLVDAVRDLLVDDMEGELALLPLFAPRWYGGGIDVHDMPTSHGSLSFAVRWHGERPALLWELEPKPGAASVRITAPGLDPSWSSADARGEALLAPVARPAGLEAVRVVSEHPDIDPAMRRPGSGEQPSAEPSETTTLAPPIEGGTFS